MYCIGFDYSYYPFFPSSRRFSKTKYLFNFCMELTQISRPFVTFYASFKHVKTLRNVLSLASYSTLMTVYELWFPYKATRLLKVDNQTKWFWILQTLHFFTADFFLGGGCWWGDYFYLLRVSVGIKNRS